MQEDPAWELNKVYVLLHARAPVADLVRVSDQSSEDPGSNRGWISISFFTLSLHTLLLRGHMSNYTQEPMKFTQDPCCSTMCNRTWEKGAWQKHWSLLLIVPGVWHSSSKLATAITLPALPTHISPLTRCRLTQLASGASIQLHFKGSMWLLCTKNGYKLTYTRTCSCWALYSGLPHCQFLCHFGSAFITATLQGFFFKSRCVLEVGCTLGSTV